jgi:hypothetical protein
MLAGMAATFAGVATLAAIGGGWAVRANEYRRIAALALLALFGVALLFPALSDRLTRPLVALGSGLLLTGAALHGASAQTSLLLAAYAVGAATSLALALALVIGGRGTTPVLRRKAPMD